MTTSLEMEKDLHEILKALNIMRTLISNPNWKEKSTYNSTRSGESLYIVYYSPNGPQEFLTDIENDLKDNQSSEIFKNEDYNIAKNLVKEIKSIYKKTVNMVVIGGTIAVWIAFW